MFIQGSINYDLTKYLPRDSKLQEGIGILRSEFDDIGQAMDAFEKKLAEMDIFRTVIKILPVWGWIIAALVIVGIAVLLSSSYLEPLFSFAFCGISVFLGAVSNGLFKELSFFTTGFCAVLQALFTFPFFVITFREYEKDRDLGTHVKQVMINSLKSLLTCALPEVFIFMVMIFLRSDLGKEIGMVSIKGIAISLVVALVAEPLSLKACGKLLEKTGKDSILKPLEKRISEFEKIYPVFLVIILGSIVFSLFYVKSFKFEYDLPIKNMGGNLFNFEGFTTADISVKDVLLMVYENSDEEKMLSLSEELDKTPKVSRVLSRANIFERPFKSGELAEFTKEMGIDEDIIKIVIYDAYGNREAEEMTLETFVGFVIQKAEQNAMIRSMVGEDNMALLYDKGWLFKETSLTEKRSSKDLASLMGLNESITGLVYWFSGKEEMSVKEFLDFLNNPFLVSTVLSSQKDTLKTVSYIADSVVNEAAYSADELSDFLSEEFSGLPKEAVGLVYAAYFAEQEYIPGWRMRIEDIIDHVMKSDTFSMIMEGEMGVALHEARETLNSAKKLFTGEKHSRALILTESLDGDEYSLDNRLSRLENIKKTMDRSMKDDHYIIGLDVVAADIKKMADFEYPLLPMIIGAGLIFIAAILLGSIIKPVMICISFFTAYFLGTGICGMLGKSMFYPVFIIVLLCLSALFAGRNVFLSADSDYSGNSVFLIPDMICIFACVGGFQIFGKSIWGEYFAIFFVIFLCMILFSDLVTPALLLFGDRLRRGILSHFGQNKDIV
ncbi:MAG: hypothetical protein K6D96_04280 [Acetatifactor sp.]|nr:hypothetical protein [Acetatifactor sp.]